MCGDQQHYSGDSEDEDEEEGPGQLSADNKEYYDKLMVITTDCSQSSLFHYWEHVFSYYIVP